MARKVLGKLIDQHNNPLSGWRVQAWDDDWPSADDFMGDAITDANGNYTINYDGGHWDPAPHNITTWRPDIYVVAQARNHVGGWSSVDKSGVSKDHRLDDDLRKNMQLSVGRPEEKHTAFNAAVHGFHFINNFTIPPACSAST